MIYQLVTVPVTVSSTVSFPRMDPLVDRIIQSKSFGRSETYANLLRYLVACSAAGNPPKEVTIAVEILGKTNFDSSESSTVRVYMYKLRKKLADY
ncbi:MAG: helix-turn-helix domain-containing protein [Bacteroidota bacterium]